jgi:hypothetical protein
LTEILIVKVKNAVERSRRQESVNIRHLSYSRMVSNDISIHI